MYDALVLALSVALGQLLDGGVCTALGGHATLPASQSHPFSLTAFVLPATQPAPTVHSPLVSRLPNRVTGGKSREGLRDSHDWPRQTNAQGNGLRAVFPVDTDPHFIIYVPQKEDSLCFNINEEPGVILSLVQDPDTGVCVCGGGDMLSAGGGAAEPVHLYPPCSNRNYWGGLRRPLPRMTSTWQAPLAFLLLYVLSYTLPKV